MERSDTHQQRAETAMDFATLYPSYRLIKMVPRVPVVARTPQHTGVKNYNAASSPHERMQHAGALDVKTRTSRRSSGLRLLRAMSYELTSSISHEACSGETEEHHCPR